MQTSDLVCVTLVSVVGGKGDEEVVLTDTTGAVYRFFHSQSCCEHVYLEDVTGDVADLLGSPLVMAEAAASEADEGSDETTQWTFYKFATVKGYVTFRWYGSSNGYYSVSVDLEKVEPVQDEDPEPSTWNDYE